MVEKLTSTVLNSLVPYAMPVELEWVRNFAASLQEGAIVVMIGAGPGVFALALFEGLVNPIDFFVIDHKTCSWVDVHLQLAGVRTERVVYLVADSSDVGRGWRRKQVDFLLVDGDHSYSGVLKDIDAWWPVVRRGGTVFFHDFLAREGGFSGVGEWSVSDVARAVEDRRTGEWEILEQVGISLVVKKK